MKSHQIRDNFILAPTPFSIFSTTHFLFTVRITGTVKSKPSLPCTQFDGLRSKTVVFSMMLMHDISITNFHFSFFFFIVRYISYGIIIRLNSISNGIIIRLNSMHYCTILTRLFIQKDFIMASKNMKEKIVVKMI